MVLVVEDNEVAVLQIRTILEESGHRVTVACNGGEALESVRHQVPDAIVLDLMMPGIDGFEVLEKIRSTEQTARVPVLVLTAKELTAEDLARLKHNHIQQLIRKGSVDRDQLLSHIAELLGEPSPQPTPAAKPAVKPAAQPASPLAPSGSKTILVVEDHPDNMLAMAGILEELGHEYIKAEDGRQAVKLARQFRPAMILMDMELPELSGMDATGQIKADPSLANIPIVAVTAKAMKGDREEILASGCDEYLPKPLDSEKLARIIHKWMS